MTRSLRIVTIEIPDRLARTGYGPLKNDNTKITRESEVDHR